MKIKKELLRINKKKLISFAILFIVIIILFLIFIFNKKEGFKIFNSNKQEEFVTFSCEKKSFILNDDYSYTFYCLITVRELDGIEYIKYNKDGEEITLDCKGKNKIGIDYTAHESIEYSFFIKPTNQQEKEEKIKLERKVAGRDTYKLVNGVYANTPFLENFNEKYTRYVYPNENNVLTPGNWIYKDEPENWYSYNNQKWANIYVECEGIENYYVWIPRYVYKLDQENQRSDVKFVDVFNNYKNAETGEELSARELFDQGYQLPEAFTWENNDNETTSISGYWSSKYALSELQEFNLDYNISTAPNSIVVSNFANNMGSTAASFIYAINGEIKNTTTTLGDYTFTGLTEGESYIVNVTALTQTGAIAGSMTKIVEPTEVNPPKLDGFDQDTTFYVYWDDNGIEHNEIPISQNPPANWYNYTYSKWANIVTRNNGIETYLVWIPRYQYSLNQTSQRSNVKFILGTGTETFEGYKIPEAFWFDKNNDNEMQDDEKLTGYWSTKYCLSQEETQEKISAELAAGDTYIKVKDIKGTAVSGNLKYEYYINGTKVHDGTTYNENYVYTGLNLNTIYTINIIARNSSTNQYIGAITKKVKTNIANEPDLSSFRSNEGLKNRTYYCIYNGEQIQEYIPITQNPPSNWYDYSNSRWANIVVTDGKINGTQIQNATSTSYFVWIPRYEYSILQSLQDWSNREVSNARTSVTFLSGTSTETDPGYKIPDAFWFDKNSDGQMQDDEKLTGYWSSKYCLSE